MGAWVNWPSVSLRLRPPRQVPPSLAALLGLTWVPPPPPKAEIPMGQWGRGGSLFSGYRSLVQGLRQEEPVWPDPPLPGQAPTAGGGLTQEQQRMTMQKDSMMPEMPTTQVRRRKRMTPKMFCRQGR